MSGEWFLPSKREALIWLGLVDHLFEYPRGCPLNRAFFIFHYKPLNQRFVQRLFRAGILRGEPFRALSTRHLEPFPAQILCFAEGYPTGFFELKSEICAVFTG